MKPRPVIRKPHTASGEPSQRAGSSKIAIAAAAIFAVGIGIGVGIGYFRASPSAESAPRAATTPPLLAPPPLRSGPATFTPPQFLAHEPEPAPELGEEGATESYSGDTPPATAIASPVESAEPPQALPAEPPRPGHRPPELAAISPGSFPSAPPESFGGTDAPWRKFAVAAPAMDGRPRIVVVIDDLGVDRARSAQIIRLPGPLTAAFLPYAYDLPGQTQAAKATGHELMVHVPMEPKNPDLYAGPDAMLVGADERQLKQRLDSILGRFDSYVGINNHMGSLFTEDQRGMAVVMAALKQRGLLFLDSRTTNHTVGPELARRFGVPFAERHVFLDNENDVGHIRARLSELEEAARQRGYAIGIGHPRDGTVEALQAWLPTLARKGLVLVPISAVVRQRMAAQTTKVVTAPSHDEGATHQGQ